jgi:hypothetical protein
MHESDFCYVPLFYLKTKVNSIFWKMIIQNIAIFSLYIFYLRQFSKASFWSLSPEIRTSSINLAQLSRFLPKDGEITQSLKRRAVNKHQDNVQFSQNEYLS